MNVLLNLLNELRENRLDVRLCQASYCFSAVCLIKSIMSEHECKIL